MNYPKTEKDFISEERYRCLFEHSRDGMYFADAHGNFIEVNDSALDLLGYSRDEMTKLGLHDIFESPQKADEFGAALEIAGLLKNQEHTLRRKDGKLVQCLLSSSLARSSKGEITGQQGTIHNMTDTKEIEKAMFDAQKLESLGVLAGGIAHDFNNLLAVIQGNAELASREVQPGSDGFKFLEQIEKASQRSGELCKQLLSYAGKGKLTMQPIDLNQVIQEFSQLLQVSVSKNTKIKYSLLKNLPPIMGDATQIRQVILNLVINASEAIGDSQGIITLATGIMHATKSDLLETKFGKDFDEGDYVYFEVNDTGSGMDSRTINRIFDPFFTTKFSGRGLGLAAVLGIVRSHKGTLKVTSEKNRGTNFRILIPPCPVSKLEKTTANSNPQVWKSSGLALIVDDEDSVRLMATHMMHTFGFEVLEASDGDEAIQIFKDRSGEIDLVLLDITMPRLSGDKVCSELYSFNPAAQILLMSGYSQEHTTDLFQGKKLPGFIQKPFKLVTLMEKVRETLEAPRTKQNSVFTK